MSGNHFLHIGSVRDAEAFRLHLQEHRISIPCDREIVPGSESPLAQPVTYKGIRIGNRFTIHPMEGWDGTPDGRPTELTVRRWRNFGRSGAKLIWGGEAVAVRRDGRANPHQLLINTHTREELARLREALIEEHRQTYGSTDGLVVGLQLTHSGRFSRPNASSRPEPRILYHHPLLDRRLGLTPLDAVISDGEIRQIIESFHEAGRLAREIGFDFVDLKHCHGYLGHEFLSAHTREGEYGGSFENRTRFLREVVEGIRAVAPGLEIGVRLSAIDTVPFTAELNGSSAAKVGRGIPEAFETLLPYRWGFGVSASNPLEEDLSETVKFLSLLSKLGIGLVNVSAGCPYYNPHIQRPALFPPSDGYQPPEDPLVGVARQIQLSRELKQLFPDLLIVGSGYSYLQEFLPHVAQAAVREGWVDSVGLGRMVLAYPELPRDVLEGRPVNRKRLCRTFSDCTTAPRNGLPSGCYPLDAAYKNSEGGERLKVIKHGERSALASIDIENILERIKPRRKPQGIAAALLPFEADGRIAVEAFQKHLQTTHRAGMMNAVNMDTGYVNYLSDDEKTEVLRWTRAALGDDVAFVAGAYIEGREGDVISLYRMQMDEIASWGGIPIIFQSVRLKHSTTHEKLGVYREISKGFPEVIAFELSPVFAPNGEIFDQDTVRGLMDIPEIKGIKHSSLDRLLEFDRLELRDSHRPDFRIYTGNDLGINMIEYGSDYLLGLATFAPEKFAERDRLWNECDAAYYALSDALQHLGNVAFRAPVPQYKHSAAVFLHLTGRIPSPRPHPHNATRPEWEADLLRDCAARLGYDVA